MIDLQSDEYFMNKAIEQAEIAFEKGEVPVGAVITCDNQIIAKAYNLSEQLNDVTAHAEIQAITAAADYLGGKYLRNCKMFVTLEPCPMCAGALYWSQLDELIYGAQDVKRGATRFQGIFHPKTKIKGGIFEKQCGELLSNFFKQKR